MINRLIEIILPFIIRYMVHKKETLTQKERRAQEVFLSSLQIKQRRTRRPVIVAMIGLVGSGKSSVAKELAGLIGTSIIEGDKIRVLLRKEGERYEGTRKIAENAALEIIKRGGNVIMDSDYIDAKKRASLCAKAKKAKARLLFIRTYADYDVMAGRVNSAKYQSRPEDFFGGASSIWNGEGKGAVVKLREMWRRTPNHYRWENKVGGRWILKKLPFKVFAMVDTTDAKKWQTEIGKITYKLSYL